MEKKIEHASAVEWLMKNGYDRQGYYLSCNGKLYGEYKHNSGLIYRLPIADDFDSCEQELFRNYIKGNTHMKTTFTLQDILSIKKDTWLELIKRKMTEDQIKSMKECNNHWHNIAFDGHQEVDKYRVFTGNFFEYADGEKSSKTIFISFYKDSLFIDGAGLSDAYCEHYAKQMENCPEAGLLELMKIITQLAIVLYNMDASNPITVGTQVSVMLNELINNQTQGK